MVKFGSGYFLFFVPLFFILIGAKQDFCVESVCSGGEVGITAPRRLFYTANDVNSDLIELGLPDSVAALFACIAVVESGWGLNSTIASRYHNYFGFMRSRPSADGSYFYRFDSREDALCFVKDWVAISPPDTALVVWLRRRGYNPDPAYYTKVGGLFSNFQK